MAPSSRLAILDWLTQAKHLMVSSHTEMYWLFDGSENPEEVLLRRAISDVTHVIDLLESRSGKAQQAQ